MAVEEYRLAKVTISSAGRGEISKDRRRRVFRFRCHPEIFFRLLLESLCGCFDELFVGGVQ
jgi:hypothetical protein